MFLVSSQSAVPSVAGERLFLDGKTLRAAGEGKRDDLDWLPQKAEWAGLRAVGRVESTRIIGAETMECRYVLSTLTALERFAAAARAHWAIENGQHWVLDVQFGEDANRARKDRSATNLALVRRMALNVLRRNGSVKQSLRIRKKCAPPSMMITASG